jgi:RND family efflux transporter MFP subunit
MSAVIMKSAIGLALISVAAIAVAFVVTKDRNGAQVLPAGIKPVIEFASTDLAQVQVSDITRTLPLTGTFSPVNWAFVKSRVAGDMREVYVREGQSVKKGQIIARIDVTELEAKVQEKIGNLESSHAQLELAEKVRINNQQLLRQGFISRNAFDNSESGYLQAKGTVKANEAQLALARKSLEDSIIRAPIDGIISERFVQAGEKVPLDTKLFTVMDLSRMELAASVPASEIGNVKLGQQVIFKVDGFTDRVFTGRIDRINPATQSGSRSIAVYAVIENGDQSLKGGMFGKGTLMVSTLAGVSVVPVAAVHEEGGKPSVYLVANGVLKKQPIKTGLRSEDTGYIEVREGLERGATVVSGNFVDLREGATVRVSKPSVHADP